MLEFLGFIALLALIFGVSFADALGGFFKFIIIAVGVCAALALIAKLIQTKKGCIFVIVASIGAIALGVWLLNDNSLDRTLLCDNLALQDRGDCLLKEAEKHDANVNMGWGYVIVGGITGLTAFSNYYGEDKNTAKTRSGA